MGVQFYLSNMKECIVLLTFCCLQYIQVSCIKNVVLMIADDFRPNIGVYEGSNYFSSPGMKTPNLDHLASKSLVLTNAYTQVALCAPSRSSFLTGRRPDTIRCYDILHRFRENLPNTISMPQYFKENGYTTLGSGKIFHPGRPDTDQDDDYPTSWSEKVFHTESTDNMNVSWYSYTEEELVGVTLRDVANTDHFIQSLTDIGNEPFFFAMGFHKPHLPWDAPKEFFDLYPDEENIDLPFNPFIPEDMPESAWTPLPSYLPGLTNFDDCSPEGSGIPDIGTKPNVTYPDDKKRELRRAYYAAISFMDHQVGRVMRAIEEAGLADNTVVMFVGDHGLHVGEHSMWAKYTAFEIAHRAPMMIHIPGRVDQSMFSENLVEFVDILPTLVEAAGLPELEKCPENSRNIAICSEGTSLLRIAEGNDWKKAVFYQQPRNYFGSNDTSEFYHGYSVRTPQFRYTEWVGLQDPDLDTQRPDWDDIRDWGELYDLAGDPSETINLYREEEWRDTREMLSKILHGGWFEHN